MHTHTKIIRIEILKVNTHTYVDVKSIQDRSIYIYEQSYKYHIKINVYKRNVTSFILLDHFQFKERIYNNK